MRSRAPIFIFLALLLSLSLLGYGIVFAAGVASSISSRLKGAHIQSCPPSADPECTPFASPQIDTVNVTLRDKNYINVRILSAITNKTLKNVTNIMMIHGFPFGSDYFEPVARVAMNLLRDVTDVVIALPNLPGSPPSYSPDMQSDVYEYPQLVNATADTIVGIFRRFSPCTSLLTTGEGSLRMESLPHSLPSWHPSTLSMPHTQHFFRPYLRLTRCRSIALDMLECSSTALLIPVYSSELLLPKKSALGWYRKACKPSAPDMLDFFVHVCFAINQ